MTRAIVEGDGRIRLPQDVSTAAHLHPGQELDVTYSEGVLTVYTAGEHPDLGVSEGFMAGLERALEESEMDASRGRRATKSSKPSSIVAHRRAAAPRAHP